jgi:hypothetical protein
MQFADSLLFMAGCTNTASGFGNNDIYLTISNPTLHSKNNSCDTGQDNVVIDTTSVTQFPKTYSDLNFLPSFITVDTGTINFSIKLLCGDTSTIPAEVAQVKTEQLEVFPNPANNLINIKANGQSGSVTIIDCYGKVLIKRDIDSIQSEIDIHSLAPGIYFIKGIFGDEYVYSRFVKN